jgi:hypothetical protein
MTPVSFNVPLAVREALDREAMRGRKSSSAVLREIVSRHFRIDKQQTGDAARNLEV